MAYGRRSMGGSFKMRLIIGLAMAAFAAFKYFSTSQVNEVTGEKQHISMTTDQEIQLGLQSRDQMAQQHGGLYPNQEYQDYLDQVGNKLVATNLSNDADYKTDYQYDFHLLADPRVVNAFALPGGQVFITFALFNRLKNEDQLAGVLGHEIGHVEAKHSAARISKQEFTQGLTGAAVMASGDYGTAQMAQLIGQTINMKYGREQELQSDELGVRFMCNAGYNPEALEEVMEILAQASGGQRAPEFQSTHPSPENRVERIRESIVEYCNHESNNRLKIN